MKSFYSEPIVIFDTVQEDYEGVEFEVDDKNNNHHHIKWDLKNETNSEENLSTRGDLNLDNMSLKDIETFSEKAESLIVNVATPYHENQESFIFDNALGAFITDDELSVDRLDNESCISQGTSIHKINHDTFVLTKF